MEPVVFPQYVVLSGPRRGDIRRFDYVTQEEFERLGRNASVTLEWNRFRARMISADPAEKSKWSQRRKHRRNTELEIRQREAEQKRRRRASVR